MAYAGASYDLSEIEIQYLAKAAIDAKSTAYCPYSNFRVGAAILATTGEIITGANIENAAYPVGTCAERVALGTAITSNRRSFRALAVAADTSTPCSPCGMCRQFIREFCGKEMKVYMYAKGEGVVEVKTMGELLPMSFGFEDLNRGQGEGDEERGEKKKVPGQA